MLDILDDISAMAHSIPPVDNKLSRFGNPAFRTFYDKVSEVIASCNMCLEPSADVKMSPELHSRIPGVPAEATPEIEMYFKEAWGHRERVDYGSGMELNFLCWLHVMRLHHSPW